MKTLKLTLKKQWFDRHLKDKKHEYREVTPFWIKRLLRKKNGDKLTAKEVNTIYRSVKETESPTFILQAILFGKIDFAEYDEVQAFNGGYMSESLPNFNKEVKSIGIGIGLKKWGAPDYPVFIIDCGEITEKKNIKE